MKKFFFSLVLISFYQINILSSENWTALGNLTAMTGEFDTNYAGWSLDMNSSGTRIAVGELGFATNTGRARVYEFNSGLNSWSAIGGDFDMVGGANDDYAGNSVSINADGTIVAVGELGWSGSKGRVRVYEFNGSSWSVIGGSDDMTGESNTDQAGYSVSINADGSIIAVGEPEWGNQEGRTRVFKFDGSSWSAIGGAEDMTGLIDDNSGFSVSINTDGTIVAVGEKDWNVPGDSNNGRVRVFKFDGSSWSGIGGSGDMTGQYTNSQAGNSVSINADGSIVAVGEFGWSGTKGRVRVFKFDGSSWSAIGGSEDITGLVVGDQLGNSVKLNDNGTRVVVGEVGYDTNGNSQVGRALVYEFNTNSNSWSAIGGSEDMIGITGNDRAGYSVTINSEGSIVALGIPYWDADGGDANGLVRAYKFSSTGSTGSIGSAETIIIPKVSTHAPLFACANSVMPGSKHEYSTNLFYLEVVGGSNNKFFYQFQV